MKFQHNHSYNPDREAIKMRWEFQFIEEPDRYILVLNEEDYHIYPKEKYTGINSLL